MTLLGACQSPHCPWGRLAAGPPGGGHWATCTRHLSSPRCPPHAEVSPVLPGGRGGHPASGSVHSSGDVTGAGNARNNLRPHRPSCRSSLQEGSRKQVSPAEGPCMDKPFAPMNGRRQEPSSPGRGLLHRCWAEASLEAGSLRSGCSDVLWPYAHSGLKAHVF